MLQSLEPLRTFGLDFCWDNDSQVHDYLGTIVAYGRAGNPGLLN